MTAYLSKDDYPNVNGSTSDFAVSFPFLQRVHVHVFVTPSDGTIVEKQVTADFVWTSDSLIHFISPPAAGSDVLIKRETPSDSLLDILSAPSTITAEQINVIALQLLYLIQEALDAGADTEGLGDLLNDLRWTYDVGLSGSAVFGTGQRLGPAGIAVDSAYLPAGGTGSVVKTYSGSLTVDHVLGIRKNGATSVGTLTISHTDLSATLSVPSDVPFVAGDDISLVTLTDGGLSNLGVTFRLRRVPQ